MIQEQQEKDRKKLAAKSKISEKTKKLTQGRKKGVENLYKSPPKSHRVEIKQNSIDL